MPSVTRIASRIASCLLFLLAALGTSQASAATFPPGFSEVNIPRPDGAATWNEAVGMQFQANGRLWVWERGGRVWIVDDANPVTSAIMDISPEVGAWADHGMLGFALHPDFEATGYIYLMFVVDRHHLMNCDSPATGAPVCSASYNPATNDYNSATIGRIVRYRMQLPAGQSDYRNASVVDMSSRRTLLGETLRTQPKSTGCPIMHSSHGVGTLAFGMDGTLLASCGDGASYTSTDVGSASETYYVAGLADGIIRSAENVGAFRSQMPTSLSGKVLRLDPDTGNGVSSNPLYDASQPRSPRSRMWTLGIRNGFRFTVKPLSGSHNPSDGNPGAIFLGDVGWNTWEDLNVVRTAGTNLGWPLFEGLTAHSGYSAAETANLDAPNPLFGTGGCTIQFLRFEDLLIQDSLNAGSWPNPCNASQQITSTATFKHTRPALEWRHSPAQTRFSAYDLAGNAVAQAIGSTAPDGSAVSGPTFSGSSSQGGVWYTGEDYPATYKNTYFHGDYSGQWIRNFVFDANNKLTEVRDFIGSGGGIVDMATNPVTGGLYYNSWTAFVRKVTYSPTGNVPPVARATASAVSGNSPLTVSFDGTASSDANNQALTYLWDFGDGTPTSTSPTPTHQFTAPAGVVTNRDVTLTVRDTGNLTAQTSILISVNNTPPTVNVTSPTDGSQYVTGGANINVPMTATVSDAQTATPNLSCQWLVVLHHNTHQHEEPVVNACASNYSLQPVGCDGETYYYSFTLTVTDEHGLQTVRESRMYPSCGGGSDTVPPTVPQNLTGQATGPGQITMSWSASTDQGGGTVAGYRIYRNGVSFATTTATSFADNTVLSSTNYTYRVAAYDNASPANESQQSNQISVTTPAAAQTIIRVNTGGPQYTDTQSRVWAADFGFNTGNISVVSNAISGTPDPALYQRDRWDPGTAPEMAYAFAVPNGNYTVNLHFVEHWSGGQAVGRRIFDVLVENQLKLDNLDIFAEAGGYRLLVKTLQTTVTDGQLNINFVHGSADDPIIGAIEILSEGGGTPPVDTQAPTVPQNLTGQAVNASQVTLNWSASTDQGGGSVAGYRIFRNGSSLTTTTATSFADNTVVAGTAYTYRVAAFDDAAPANESAQSNQVSVTTPSAPATVIRVNAGGPQYTDTAQQVWSADFGYNTGSTVNVPNAIAGTSDPALYRTERWDPPTGAELAYAFTVPNGTYTVKLHFAETWSGGQAVGRRIFDVSLENQLVLDNLDIFAQVGGYAALIKTFQVSVTDGQLNINFAHGSADDPQIGAIEILSNGGPPPVDTQPPTIPQNLTGQAPNASQVTLSWGASTDNGGGAVAGYRIYRNGSALTTTTATTFADNTVAATTTYTYRVTAYDNASPANESAQSNQISVTTPAPASTVIRVNAGGPQYTDSASRVWAADFGFTGGSITTVSNAIAGTSDPALYQRDRWDPPTAPEMSYAFNVPNGSYTVKLHFVEHWSGGQAVGRRIFDVLLENQLALDNLDIFAEAGGYTLLVKTLQTTVSDGVLNINFVHGSADDPLIGAIEILSN
jgi:fibronectin type 3 domain-containing protein/PKD repeat protein/3-deoxy-D-manno-octulosonate 8-phosphate phosphatase KdsC-like HAD superfamily phosphatase